MLEGKDDNTVILIDQRRGEMILPDGLITSKFEFIYLLRKKVIKIIKKYEKKELIDKLRESILDTIRGIVSELKEEEEKANQAIKHYSEMSDKDFVEFLKTKILYPASLKVTIRVWHKNEAFQDPMTTHVSLETSEVYASLWHDKFVDNLDEDRSPERTSHEPAGECGSTINLYGLSPFYINDAFNKLKARSIPWNVYGSCNCNYIAYLCKITLSLFEPFFCPSTMSDDICILFCRDLGEMRYYRGRDVDKFYKKTHNNFNCSGLVLYLMEHGGIYQITQLPLMSAKGNKILLSLRFLNILCLAGYLILSTMAIIKMLIEGKNNLNMYAEYPDGKYMEYVLFGSIGSTLIAHMPYWFANFIYECRGIGFWVTPKGIKWLTERAEIFEKNQKEELYSRLDALIEEVNLGYRVSENFRHELKIPEPLTESSANYASFVKQNNKQSVHWMQKRHNSRSERKSSHGYFSTPCFNDEYRSIPDLEEPEFSKKKSCSIL